MKHANRREVLGTLGALPLVGMASNSAASGKSRNKSDAFSNPTIATKSDVQEYVRLRDLDLDDPKVVKKRKKMPVGKIGNFTFGRLMSGSNLISMNMHSRDLEYVRALATHYNTEEPQLQAIQIVEILGRVGRPDEMARRRNHHGYQQVRKIAGRTSCSGRLGGISVGRRK